MTNMDEDRGVEQIIDEAVEKLSARQAEGLPEAVAAQVREQLPGQVKAALERQLAPIQSDRDALLARVKDLEAELASRPATKTVSAQASAHHNPHAVGAGLDGAFDGPGDFWGAAVRAGRTDLGYQADERLVSIESALDGQNIAEGGALVPEEFRTVIMEDMLESAVIRPGAMVLPMSTETMRYPYVRDYDHSSGQVYGGWQVYRLERGQTVPRSEPRWGQQRLTVTTQAAKTIVSNLLLADASGLGLAMFIEQGLPKAIGWAEDYDFIRGDGAGEPAGILNSGAVITTTDAGRRGATATDYLVAQDVNDMLARMLPACQRRCVFLAHPGLYQDIGAMTLSGAQFARRSQEENVPLFINGRPVFFTEHCSAPGTSGDFIAVDRSQYLIGDRQATSVISSMHNRIEELETTIIAYSRNDGQLMMEEPLQLRHGGAAWTVSCAVVLPDAAVGVDFAGTADPRLAEFSRPELNKLKKSELVDLIAGPGAGDDEDDL